MGSGEELRIASPHYADFDFLKPLSSWVNEEMETDIAKPYSHE